MKLPSIGLKVSTGTLALGALAFGLGAEDSPQREEIEVEAEDVRLGPLLTSEDGRFVQARAFGVLSIGFYALKLVNERRILRRSLKMRESEVSSLRNLPLSDAD